MTATDINCVLEKVTFIEFLVICLNNIKVVERRKLFLI